MSYNNCIFTTLNPEIIFVSERNYPTTSTPYQESNQHHHDFTQLSIVLSGELIYEINGQIYTLQKGHALLLPPNTLHSVSISPNVKCSDLHIGLQLEGIFELFPDTPLLTITKEVENFYSCALEIAYEHRQNRVGSDLMLKALITRLLVLLYRESIQDLEPDTFTSPEKKEITDFITRYINNHYMDDITLDLFSKNMYLSQAYISRIFKEETGVSPIKYLIQTRLAKAKSLLENEKLPIKLVSKQVGYDDVYHFSKLFKKYYGSPPSSYLKRSS